MRKAQLWQIGSSSRPLSLIRHTECSTLPVGRIAPGIRNSMWNRTKMPEEFLFSLPPQICFIARDFRSVPLLKRSIDGAGVA